MPLSWVAHLCFCGLNHPSRKGWERGSSHDESIDWVFVCCPPDVCMEMACFCTLVCMHCLVYMCTAGRHAYLHLVVHLQACRCYGCTVNHTFVCWSFRFLNGLTWEFLFKATRVAIMMHFRKQSKYTADTCKTCLKSERNSMISNADDNVTCCLNPNPAARAHVSYHLVLVEWL